MQTTTLWLMFRRSRSYPVTYVQWRWLTRATLCTRAPDTPKDWKGAYFEPLDFIQGHYYDCTQLRQQRKQYKSGVNLFSTKRYVERVSAETGLQERRTEWYTLRLRGE